MSEEDIIRFCSPTLAGIKPGNLFTATYDDSEQLQKELDVLANRLSAKGVKILSLRQKQGRALLYFYRPCLLKECLRHLGARLLLQQRGYPPDQPQRCLKKLWQHLQTESDFPHEIGLFLGYPPEDVQGFIEQKACNSKCTGYWKVYGDQKKAEQIFDRYKKCTACFLANWQRGVSLEQLTVKKV